MFQYTTETIINKLTDEKNSPIFKVNDTKTALYIKGVGLFKKENVCSITKYPYQAEQKATATFDLATAQSQVQSGKTLRLKVETKQVGLNTSIYADAQIRHIKPFFYEYTPAENEALSKIAEAFKAIIDKEMAMTNFNFFSVSIDDTVKSKITLTADDCYTQFVTVELAYVDENANLTVSTLAPSFTGYEDFKTIIGGDDVTITEGVEGNGTVTRLIKNLRIPTNARTNPFAPDFGGFPVPGGKYDQYVIENVTERRHIGGQVVGAIDTSLTSHILFLNNGEACEANAVSAAFEAACAEVGITIKPIATTTQDVPTSHVAGGTAPEQILARDKDVKDAAATASAAATSETVSNAINNAQVSVTVTDSRDAAAFAAADGTEVTIPATATITAND